MTRLTELDGAPRLRCRSVRQQQVDSESLILAARYARAAYVARMAGRLVEALKTASARIDAELLVPVRRYLRQRRTVAELEQLDDRMLADIGLRRDQIRVAAVESCRDVADRPSLPHRFVVWLTLALERGQTIRELRALPDPILRDIGVERYAIRDVANRMMRRKAALAARGEYRVVTVVEQLAAQMEATRQSFLAWMRHPTSLGQLRPLAGAQPANRNTAASGARRSAA